MQGPTTQKPTRQTSRIGWRDVLVDAVVLLAAALTLIVFINLVIERGAGQADQAQASALLWLIDGAILAMAAFLLMIAIVQRVRRNRLLRRLTEMVESAVDGEFGGHVLTPASGDLGRLSAATNRLVDKYRKASKRRARERDRLTTILMHIGDGALILSEIGRVRVINEPAAEILQTTTEKAVRQSFVQTARDHRIAEVWQRSRQSGVEQVQAVELSSDRFLRVTVTPFVGAEAGGYLVILQDLSTMRRLEKVRRDFISNVSHELRTPLASLQALVDTLRDGALDDPPAAQRFLDRIDVEVDKMTQMVQELLELSRVESGQAPLRMSSTPIAQIVGPAVERLQTQAERAGVTLEVALPEGLPNVLVDYERVQHVVINLVHNGIKFTPAGGSIVVSARVNETDTGFAVISVADSGIGIAPDDQARVFERFYKSDRSRTGGGTGLGLAIAKHTVLAHGGRIWVESIEGEGSTFSLTLPLDDPPPGKTTPGNTTPGNTTAVQSSRGDPGGR